MAGGLKHSFQIGGSEYENAIMIALCSVMGIEQRAIVQGKTCNGKSKWSTKPNALEKTTAPAEWDRLLPPMVHAYHAATHEANAKAHITCYTAIILHIRHR